MESHKRHAGAIKKIAEIKDQKLAGKNKDKPFFTGAYENSRKI